MDKWQNFCRNSAVNRAAPILLVTAPGTHIFWKKSKTQKTRTIPLWHKTFVKYTTHFSRHVLTSLTCRRSCTRRQSASCRTSTVTTWSSTCSSTAAPRTKARSSPNCAARSSSLANTSSPGTKRLWALFTLTVSARDTFDVLLVNDSIIFTELNPF